MTDEAAVKLGHWLEVVRRTRIGRTVKGVAFVLASYADTDGNNIFPSLATLAVAAEVDYKTAKRALADLVAYGLVEKVARRSGARGRFDEYRLILAPDMLTRVCVPTPEEFQTAVECVRDANRNKAVRTGARVPRTEPVDTAVDIDADDGTAESVRGTARPKNRGVRGTAFRGTSHSTSHRKTTSHACGGRAGLCDQRRGATAAEKHSDRILSEVL